ncbi:Deaminase domain-containing protein 1 [Intoshia linei]|uniref:Deaminase domain-containing protein 1 n=1 Tax=Intoshia linei TaxID=1819745 RepID=A0A177AXH3_9BILA|nr:Deaminase domain-containing protein 1 [Intoshia linei]
MDLDLMKNWMNCAFEAAENAYKHGETPIGAVLVYKSKYILCSASNETNKTHNPLKHAEMIIIEKYIKLCINVDLRQYNFLQNDQNIGPSPDLYNLLINQNLLKNEYKNENDQNIFNALNCDDLRLYITMEPCIMCTDALRRSEILNVICCTRNDRFGGTHFVNVATDKRENLPVLNISYAENFDSVNLLKKFYNQENYNAPPCKRIKK